MICFTQNQREEVRDLGDVAGTLNGETGMHQQNYIAEEVTEDGQTDKEPVIDSDEDEDCEYIVRRLTELECERLQAYPDNWTVAQSIDHAEFPFWRSAWDTWNKMNGKKVKSDKQILKWMDDPNSASARYKALGNSIALPFWHWMVSRMAEYLPEKATLCSLFDGIGGFPRVWEMVHGEGTAIEASEVEPFPIAISRQHFPNMKHLGDVTKVNGAEIEPVWCLTGGSPCFPAGTLVLTGKGYVEIENITVGTKVLTHKGRWRKVTDTGRKTGETVIVKGNHYGLECTPNHPFYSTDEKKVYPHFPNGKRGNYRIVDEGKHWVPAENMQGKLMAVPRTFETLDIPTPTFRFNKNLNEFPKLTEDFFYLVGRWIGDGWVRDSQRFDRPEGQKSGTIIICAGYKKEQDLKRAIEAVVDRYSVEHCRTAVKYKFTSLLLCRWLTENFGKYAYGKRIPAWVYGMPFSLRKALLKGILDTDGHRCSDTVYKLTTVSKKLAHGVRLLGETLGYSTTVYHVAMPSTCVIEGRTCHQRDQYVVRLSMNQVRTHLKDELHSWYRCRSVIPTGEVKTVYNLTVDEDNSYVAEGIVVHNCQDLSVAGKRAGMKSNLNGDEETTRSGLFLDQIRIVKEMRKADEERGRTNEFVRPRYVVWENVCLSGDTLVPCDNGYKQIKDISIGDKVKTLQGRYMPVVQTYRTKHKPVITVKCTGSDELVCTPNHPFFARMKCTNDSGTVFYTEPCFTRADALTNHHYLAYKVDTPSLPDGFISTEQAWTVGRWLADGSVDLTKSNPRIFISVGDYRINAARKHLYNLPYNVYENKPHKTATNFTFTSYEFYTLIKGAGTGAGHKKVPDYVFHLPIPLQREVLNGYISGDGSARKRKGHFEVSCNTASRELACGIARLMRNVYHCGASISKRNATDGKIGERRIHANYPSYNVYSSFSTSQYSQSFYDNGIVWQKVKNVTNKHEKADVYNLSVLEDNTYGANDIMGHNCGAFSCSNGADFQAVLREFLHVKDENLPDVPMPDEGWHYSGSIVGDGFSLAWRTHDAQYWGVPQRRKRISVVCDYGGGTAPEILFDKHPTGGCGRELQTECNGLSGNYQSCHETREGVARDSAESVGNGNSEDGELNGDGDSHI